MLRDTKMDAQYQGAIEFNEHHSLFSEILRHIAVAKFSLT